MGGIVAAVALAVVAYFLGKLGATDVRRGTAMETGNNILLAVLAFFRRGLGELFGFPGHRRTPAPEGKIPPGGW